MFPLCHDASILTQQHVNLAHWHSWKNKAKKSFLMSYNWCNLNIKNQTTTLINVKNDISKHMKCANLVTKWCCKLLVMEVTIVHCCLIPMIHQNFWEIISTKTVGSPIMAVCKTRFLKCELSKNISIFSKFFIKWYTANVFFLQQSQRK